MNLINRHLPIDLDRQRVSGLLDQLGERSNQFLQVVFLAALLLDDLEDREQEEHHSLEGERRLAVRSGQREEVLLQRYNVFEEAGVVLFVVV